MQFTTLKFTAEELLILDRALQNLPYGQVAKLINEINKQINENQPES